MMWSWRTDDTWTSLSLFSRPRYTCSRSLRTWIRLCKDDSDQHALFKNDTIDLIEKVLYGISKDFIDEIAKSPIRWRSVNMRYMYRMFTLQLSSWLRREMYPSLINPNRTVFSILTGLYRIRPVTCAGIFLRNLSRSASSKSFSNVKTGSQISRYSEI